MPDRSQDPAERIERRELELASNDHLPSLDYGSTALEVLPALHFSGGRKTNRGIVFPPNNKTAVVKIRAPKWKDNVFWIKAENFEAAQYIADAVYYYTGRDPFHFRDALFRYPPVCLSTGELLTTREKCSAYVGKIAKGPAQCQERRDYRERVRILVLNAVVSPEAVRFLRSLRAIPYPCLKKNFDAAEEGQLARTGNNEAADSDKETLSAIADDTDVSEGHGIKAPLPGLSVGSEHKCMSSIVTELMSSDVQETIESRTLPQSAENVLIPHPPYNDVEDAINALSLRDDEPQPSKAWFPPSDVANLNPNMPESVTVFKVKLSTILNDDEPPRKRIWPRNWCAEEKHALLKATEEAPRVIVGSPDWDAVSETLLKKYDFDRASQSCENVWGTLLQSYRAIRDHQWKIRSDHMGACASYWQMEAEDRARNELPQAFHLEWCGMIERILKAKMDAGGLPCSADCCDAVLDDESDSKAEDITDTHSEDAGLSGESAASLESHAEVTSDRHVPRTEPSQELCCETNNSMSATGRMRSAATLDDDDLISRIAPIVNKRIEDALQSLIAILQSQEEDAQKHREKMLAIEDEKLALMRQKTHVISTRRVLAHSNAVRASRSASANSSTARTCQGPSLSQCRNYSRSPRRRWRRPMERPSPKRSYTEKVI